jgi:pimeloyl-ACP methyl ester carboxylesterase
MPGVRNETCVLVHGAWHGPWSWDEVLTRLRERGCAALAVDLTAAAQSLESLTAELGRQLGPGSSRVVLVGHSRAGPVISQVAEHWPERVAGLVYVSGFLLENGESALRALRGDGTSPLLRDAALTPDGRHWVVAETDAKRIFYGRCAEAHAQLAAAKRVPEPAAPLMTPVRVSEGKFGRVPRCYVECLQDVAVPLSLQRRMQAALPCERVVTLDADHSPFFSAPAALAEILREEVERF